MPRVLVADDEALASMLVEDELTRAGFEVVGPFATCAEASAWLKGDTPDLAVLDLSLRDGPCTDVAAELSRRSVPFVIFSGSDPKGCPAPLRDAPWIAKPSSLDRLIPLLEGLAKTARPRTAPGLVD